MHTNRIFALRAIVGICIVIGICIVAWAAIGKREPTVEQSNHFTSPDKNWAAVTELRVYGDGLLVTEARYEITVNRPERNT